MLKDNQGSLALVKNPYLYKHLKHINICYYYIRDLAEQKKLQINYIPTTDMVADGMTKLLQRITFKRFKDQLGVVEEKQRDLPWGGVLKNIGFSATQLLL